MKRGLSTGKPTLAEAARIVACKSGPCVACAIWAESGAAPFGFSGYTFGDYHHLLSGGVRRGHVYGVCLCAWHHRAVLDWGSSHHEMRAYYGPSLAEGSKPFRLAFGSDEELLDKQAQILGDWKGEKAA